jgi:hypothetical protein
MTRARIVWLVAGMVAGTACGERAPPPPRAAAAPVPADTVAAAKDTLRGDSVMARDTARVPQ